MLLSCARYCSLQDCLHNLQSPTQKNIWGPWMKKRETAVERTKILNIFLSSVVSLWTPPGVFIFYLMSLSLGHRDTPGARGREGECRPGQVPASQCSHSRLPAAGFSPLHSRQTEAPGAGRRRGSPQPHLRQTCGPQGIATSAPGQAGCLDPSGHCQLRGSHAARRPAGTPGRTSGPRPSGGGARTPGPAGSPVGGGAG